MFLVVGLGNFGKEYALTRHNVGFMAADMVVRRFSFSDFKAAHKGLIASGVIAGEKVLVIKPQTYMNLSGDCVGSVAAFYKVPSDHIIVFHDDLDLPPLSFRIKQGGGNAGHNGLKSLDAHIGTDYIRVRVGIGKPQDKSETINYVTQNFSKDELRALPNVLDKLTEALDVLIAEGLDAYRQKLGDDDNGI